MGVSVALCLQEAVEKSLFSFALRKNSILSFTDTSQERKQLIPVVWALQLARLREFQYRTPDCPDRSLRKVPITHARVRPPHHALTRIPQKSTVPMPVFFWSVADTNIAKLAKRALFHRILALNKMRFYSGDLLTSKTRPKSLAAEPQKRV
jgi:hypothetical protein